MIRTRICDLLGIPHPIVLGGMGNATTAPLVAAVSNAGGFGTLGTSAFDAASLDHLTRQEFVKAEGIQDSQIVHAVRVALTGKAIGFGLFDSMAILGKKHCLARIDRALARLSS